VKSAICATDAEIVFIDFAQNIYSERWTTQREKSRIIIQEIIETINIHKKFCVLASQFNMEGQKGKMDLSNLWWWVVIGQLSDYVYWLEWNWNINADGSREIVGMCLKNRHGNWLHSMLNFYPKNMARKTIPWSTTNNKEELLPYCENHDNIHNEEFTF
jgi:hypothetical protein